MTYHVIQRGNNRMACFVDPEDREVFLGMLAELGPQERCDVHAYVLMTNHFHLLLTGQDPRGLSRLMMRLAHRHAARFNRRWARCGTLWDGRFRSSIVDTDKYLFSCYAYIERNPIRAGMVRRPQDHPWTSHRANGFGEPSLIVRPHRRYLDLGMDTNSRCIAYRALFASTDPEGELYKIRAAINASLPFGETDFIARLDGLVPGRTAPGKPGRPPRKSGKHETRTRSGIGSPVR